MNGFGAFILGRNMFGPVHGEWPDKARQGWWGDNPPCHAQTFVVTHYPHEPIEMAGGKRIKGQAAKINANASCESRQLSSSAPSVLTDGKNCSG